MSLFGSPRLKFLLRCSRRKWFVGLRVNADQVQFSKLGESLAISSGFYYCRSTTQIDCFLQVCLKLPHQSVDLKVVNHSEPYSFLLSIDDCQQAVVDDVVHGQSHGVIV